MSRGGCQSKDAFCLHLQQAVQKLTAGNEMLQTQTEQLCTHKKANTKLDVF